MNKWLKGLKRTISKPKKTIPKTSVKSKPKPSKPKSNTKTNVKSKQ